MLALALLFVAEIATSTAATSTTTPSEEGSLEEILVGEPSPEVVLEEPMRARAAVRIEARTSIDTQFDQDEEHVFELGLGARLEIDAELTQEIGVFVAPSFFWVTGFDKHGGDRQVTYLVTP